MDFKRFAIYHLPDAELGRFGSSWLGWDARKGRTLPHPDLPLPIDKLVSTPARYGFHATLKAPFRLADGATAQEVAGAMRAICAQLSGFEMPVSLQDDWGFMALRPEGPPPPQLIALEAALVTRLDHLRAPLTEAERARRHPDRLPPKALAHLDHWGYPFVLDAFQYHLTLTGALPVPQQQDIRKVLDPVLAPLLARPMPVRAVALMGEDRAGFFHLIEEVPLA
ncbi:DUF1045 domain-containing protein [Paracoccus sulfuroxidans]|uniref:Uncharacterized protein DUF1045 n=1 Tax=Paracoccus sulfuroxidans TaxID=384678 RepID=A0A562NSA7_9RHOB|nr:DUF1045 domain-containing protein [Paracoccus sulfuroxidans]TWI35088.1 uncharacterized protein DUF1045 [Paracoccus sulfuroxidans]